MTAAAPDHNAVLRTAARAALLPLELIQRGRSRVWLDDRGWFLIVVEFQPSSWSKGSYLNVAAMWLWREKDYLSFDYGGPDGDRIAGFTSADQDWAAATKELAELAATRVTELRGELIDIRSVARALRSSAVGFWPQFNAAIACAIAGDRESARQLMDRQLSVEAEHPWQVQGLEALRGYRDLLDDDAAFRARVEREIARARTTLKLAERQIEIV